MAAPDLKREIVPVPEWGEDATVIIGELSATDRVAFSECVGAKENEHRHYTALGLTYFIINEDGTRTFEDSEAELLAGKNVNVLLRLFEVAKKLNGLHAAVEDVEKN